MLIPNTNKVALNHVRTGVRRDPICIANVFRSTALQENAIIMRPAALLDKRTFKKNTGSEEILTLVEDIPEDQRGVERAAVPSAIRELVLALGDGVQSSRLNGVHKGEVAPTQLALALHQSPQFAATGDVLKLGRAV